MATFSTKKLDPAVTPDLPVGPYALIHKIDPSKLASYPAATDIVEFFEVPAKARIVGGFLRTTVVGAATSTVQLQAKQGGTTTNLTAALAATAAGSTPVNATVPESANPTTIQVAVGTAALNAAGDIEVILLTQNR